MVEYTGRLDDGDSVLRVVCRERDREGTGDIEIERNVRFLPLSLQSLGRIYNKIKEFDVLFNDWIRGDPEAFISNFLTLDKSGPGIKVDPVGAVWEVDDVGILFLTEIVPGGTAKAHYVFWDRILRGRDELVYHMVKRLIEEYDFQRIEVEVPLYANPVIISAKRIGFTNEGRKRNVVLYRDEWWDTVMFSMTPEDIPRIQEKRYGSEHAEN